MNAREHADDLATRIVAANDRLASAAQEITQLRTSLAEARATIRSLEMRLALATSRVTPWQRFVEHWYGSGWEDQPPCDAAMATPENQLIRLGDGTPEKEAPPVAGLGQTTAGG